MTLLELSFILDAQIEIRNRTGLYAPSIDEHDECKRWYAGLDNVEIKGDGVLISAFGNGRTPQEAMDSLVDQIKGKIIVADAVSSRRRELFVPTTLRS